MRLRHAPLQLIQHYVDVPRHGMLKVPGVLPGLVRPARIHFALGFKVLHRMSVSVRQQQCDHLGDSVSVADLRLPNG